MLSGTDTCFFGKCYYCKSAADGVCANGTSLEGALILWLPEKATTFTKWRSPWQRTYSNDSRKARWEIEDDFCDDVDVCVDTADDQSDNDRDGVGDACDSDSCSEGANLLAATTVVSIGGVNTTPVSADLLAGCAEYSFSGLLLLEN